MSNHQLRKHDRYLYPTAICMAYFGCLRGGEGSYPSTSCYHHSKHLTLKDVSIQDNTIILQLKQSKTDQLGKGSKIVIGQSEQAICPVKITCRFLQYRQQANHSDTLFRLKDCSLLTRQRLKGISLGEVLNIQISFLEGMNFSYLTTHCQSLVSQLTKYSFFS